MVVSDSGEIWAQQNRKRVRLDSCVMKGCGWTNMSPSCPFKECSLAAYLFSHLTAVFAK
jgi:hypothetical protein